MEKTAMQIALEYLSRRHSLTDKFKIEMLELEKKQLIEAYENGSDNIDYNFGDSEEYYTNKFNK